MSELEGLLTASLVRIALIYVAAHGRYSTNSAEFGIGAGENEPGLILNRLDPMELHVLRRSNVIVFLNV